MSTDAYDPRCPCCPLLLSPHSAAREAESGGHIAEGPDHRYADAYRVRLDVGTGAWVGSPGALGEVARRAIASLAVSVAETSLTASAKGTGMP